MLDVVIGGLGRNKEPVGYFLRRETPRGQAQHIDFTAGEPVGISNSGFAKRGGHLVCTYFDENFLNFAPAAHQRLGPFCHVSESRRLRMLEPPSTLDRSHLAIVTGVRVRRRSILCHLLLHFR
jgi:hypothetical protein